jgi:hypothetical protein
MLTTIALILTNKMSAEVVQRGDSDVKVIDKGIKNTFKWEWLEKKVNDEFVSKYIRKINIKGVALCSVCNKRISYAGRGWKSLEQHLKKKLHRDNVKIQESNYRLSSMYRSRYTIMFVIKL